MNRKALVLFVGSATLVGLACGGGASEQTRPNPPPQASAAPTATASAAPVDHSKEIEKIAAQAYVWGYPALFMEREKRTMTTNVRLPLGTFAHGSKLPRPEDADVLPSRDTLLSSAWLELNDGAWSLKLPDMGGRWFSIQMFDAYGQPIGAVDAKTGTKRPIVITGPAFKGTLPKNAEVVPSTTSTVWLLGRTRVMSDADVKKVSALLKKWQLAPLPPAVAPKDLPPPPLGRPQDLKFGAPDIFDELGAILKSEPPPKDVQGSLADFAKAGIGPGMTPSKKLPQEEVAALAQGIKDGAELIEKELEKLPTRKNGWDIDATFGKRGADPLRQAAWVLRGLDWPMSSEGLVAIARVDDGDRVLSGAHQYDIHFDKDKMPPAKAFWTLTMYTGRSAGLIPGAKRWSVTGSQLKKNADGSIDVTASEGAPPPKTPAQNWLPAPKGEAFMVVLRLYEPDAAAASWEPPPVKRLK
jgi:hypothetical protein